MTGSTSYDAHVRAWAAALRAGDARTWAEFRTDARSLTGTGPLPGSAQLELVRRLGSRDLDDFGALADLVLKTASPGRGMVDPPLPWPQEPRPFGTPAIEPDQLPDEELIRAACATLGVLLCDQPLGARKPRRPLLRRGASFVLAGAPATVAAVRAELLAAGMRDGGPEATYLVLGGPLETVMAERWQVAVEAGSGIRWRRLWQMARSRDRVHEQIDLPRLAREFTEQAGADRVHLILDDVPARVARLLGVTVEVAAPDPVATDLLRVLNPVLVLAAGEAGRQAIVDGPWTAAVARTRRAVLELGVPAAMLPWAEGAWRGLVEEIAAGDYAVHGDLAGLRGSPVVRVVPDADVLARALDLIADLWRHRGRQWGEGVS